MADEIKEKKRKRNRNQTSNKYLAKLNEGFEQSKVDQILRLLSDQEELNKRFHECALIEEDEDIKDDDVEDEDGCGDDKENDDSNSDVSVVDTERKIAQRLAQRRHKSAARCKTSLGFHNDIGLPEVPYSTDRLELRESDSSDVVQRDNAVLNTRVNRPESGNPRRRMYKLRNSMPSNSGDDNDIPVTETRRFRPKTSYGERGRKFPRQPSKDTDSDSDALENCAYDSYHDIDSFKDRQNYSRSAPLGPRGRVLGFCDTPTLSHPRESVPLVTPQVPPIPQKASRVHPLPIRHTSIMRQTTQDSLRSPRTERDSSRSVSRTEPDSSRSISNSHTTEPQTRPTSSSVRPRISLDISPLTNNTASTKALCSTSSLQRPVQSRQGSKGNKTDKYKVQQRRPKNLRQFENRASPVTVMKLPPLDPTVGKPVPAAQRLLSVGKDSFL